MRWVVVGRFGKAHGLRGLVKVHSFTQPEDNILRYSHWHMQSSAGWVPVKLEDVRMQGRSLLAKVEGIDDRDAVIQLTNCDLAVAESALPSLPEGEHYWFELISMRVINQQGIELGEVKDILSTGANDVLVVRGEREHLIPFLVPQYVVQIDKKAKQMIVDWDENF
ncbi:MAG: ribosome maturation factor RimM [Legionellaceae bacterium]|nr:ribosome maturation factor RimM [Legionellaceae bacterium]